MKIDRRCFLSLGIGAAAGITLSPLPWKLTDDLSIWTQMWPWTPVPPDGEAIYVNSTCTLCPGGCGITVRKIDKRAVKIEGMEGHPINNGGICILGLAGLQLLYGPTRIKTPLKRNGNRGENKWTEISWEDAIAEIVTNLQSLRSSNASHTLSCITDSDTGIMAEVFKRFLTAFGSPNFMWMPSLRDTYSLVLKFMHGQENACVGFDVEHSDFILSFGSGILEGWLSPVRMFRSNSLWKENKVPVIQFESRLSNSAAKADKWYPINPGTEAVLALGIAHVIIKEALYNKDFVNNYVFGFEDWKDGQGKPQKGFRKIVLENYSPEYTASLTGVPADEIISIAKKFVQASKPLALCGRGKGTTPGSFHEIMAVHALNALVGNINKEGGVFAVTNPLKIEWPDVTKDEIAEKGLEQPRIDGAGTEKYPFQKSSITRFVKEVENGSQVGALFVYGANPCYCLADTTSVVKAFSKIPFIVSFATHLDETVMQSDIVLPIHTYLEGYSEVIGAAGYPLPFVGLAKPVVKPLYNTQYAGDVLFQISKGLGDSIAEAFAWESYEKCLEETFGDQWEKLNNDGYIISDDAIPEWNSAFTNTPSKKFEFFSQACKYSETDAASDAVPYFKQAALQGNEREFPLILIPYDTIRLSSGAIGNPPFLTKTVEDTILKGNDGCVEINPSTGRKYGLADGKYAILSTPKGKARVKVHFFEGIMPDVIAIPRGLGHTAYDKYLAGKGVNVNELLGTLEDPVSGLDAAWGSRASISRA